MDFGITGRDQSVWAGTVSCDALLFWAVYVGTLCSLPHAEESRSLCVGEQDTSRHILVQVLIDAHL